MEFKATIEKEFDVYKRMQNDLQKLIQTRTQLASQASENEGVLEVREERQWPAACMEASVLPSHASAHTRTHTVRCCAVCDEAAWV